MNQKKFLDEDGVITLVSGIKTKITSAVNAASDSLSSKIDYTRLLSGEIPPTENDGADGQLYLDTGVRMFYKKIDGTWIPIGTLTAP